MEENRTYHAWKHGIVCLKNDLYMRYLTEPPVFLSCCYCQKERDLWITEYTERWEDHSLAYHGVRLMCLPCQRRFECVTILRSHPLENFS